MKRPKLPDKLGRLTVVDRSGCRYGRLIAISFVGNKRWKCLCDCGNITTVATGEMVSGSTRSCGCLQRELSRNRCKSRATHGMTKTPTYRSWQAMHVRCRRKTHPAYSRYGGAGISICDAWYSFEQFVADMGERPSGFTLDRFPNRCGNYKPGNCRWATRIQQGRNTSANHLIEYNGQQKTIAEWSEETGLARHVLYSRLYQGWSPHRTLTTPVRP